MVAEVWSRSGMLCDAYRRDNGALKIMVALPGVEPGFAV